MQRAFAVESVPIQPNNTFVSIKYCYPLILPGELTNQHSPFFSKAFEFGLSQNRRYKIDRGSRLFYVLEVPFPLRLCQQFDGLLHLLYQRAHGVAQGYLVFRCTQVEREKEEVKAEEQPRLPAKML